MCPYGQVGGQEDMFHMLHRLRTNEIAPTAETSLHQVRVAHDMSSRFPTRSIGQADLHQGGDGDFDQGS